MRLNGWASIRRLEKLGHSANGQVTAGETIDQSVRENQSEFSQEIQVMR
jgi:hypothetical protein